jgi:creatinine amidohydrolase
MSNTPEVRYERLRPQQIVAAREACSVAYLPIGTLEWHSFHNPVGLDTLKAHGLAVRCAERTGGLVFPSLWYGESREQAMMEANAGDRDKIAEGMHLPQENFDQGHMQTTHLEQTLAYQRLLLHTLMQIRSLGFDVIAIVAGHYPLIDHARAACSLFHQMPPRPKPITWAFTGWELVYDQGFDVCGDHAGKWETSLLMALDPGMVDLSPLEEPGGMPPVGATNNGVENASAEFGEQAVGAIVDKVDASIRELMDNHTRYQGHGAPLFVGNTFA